MVYLIEASIVQRSCEVFVVARSTHDGLNALLKQSLSFNFEQSLSVTIGTICGSVGYSHVRPVACLVHRFTAPLSHSLPNILSLRPLMIFLLVAAAWRMSAAVQVSASLTRRNDGLRVLGDWAMAMAMAMVTSWSIKTSVMMMVKLWW